MEKEIVDINYKEDFKGDDVSCQEREVWADFRCWYKGVPFAMPDCSSTIDKWNTVKEFIDRCKSDYEKQYEKVELVEIRIGELEITVFDND